MKRKRRVMGTNLALLDVMACGFGAAVLLFLIVKHHTGAQPIIEMEASYDGEILSMLQQSEATLAEQIKAIAQQIATMEAQNESNRKLIDTHKAKQAELVVLQFEIAREQTKNRGLEKEVLQVQPQQTSDVIEAAQVGEEDYLIGLKVEGKRIAILLDYSASMTDEKLIDIITRKVSSDSRKIQGPKWHRTIRVARWLLARLPASSQVSVVAFSEKAQILNAGAWANSRDANRISGIMAEIGNLVPSGGTNLEAGLRALKKLNPAPTDIYVITDGLPTQSVSTPFLSKALNLGNIVPKCRKKATTVSGHCREVIFESSILNAAPSDYIRVNVILLPIEGDPVAAPRFWNWTAKTGGVLLVPAVGWP